MSYCVTMTTSSGSYSLFLQNKTTSSFIIMSFWAGNVFHRVCLGSASRGTLLLRTILNWISSFLSLFETPPPCIALIEVGEKLDVCLIPTLSGTRRPSIVSNFCATEFENSSARPTCQIIEIHDYRTIIDFLLMKLRIALDRHWLQNLPILHQVLPFQLESIQLICSISYNLFFFFSVSLFLNTLLKKHPQLSRAFPTIGTECWNT